MKDGGADKIARAIIELKHRRPFEPFRIVTAKGDRLLVVESEKLAIGRTQMFYVFPGSDRFVFIPMNQLVAVEQFEKRPAA